MRRTMKTSLSYCRLSFTPRVRQASGLAGVLFLASLIQLQAEPGGDLTPSVANGALTPGGSPRTSMKSLEQVEPRRPLLPRVSGVDVTDANAHYVITKRGSYYLTENLSVERLYGIRVAAEGVTLDLEGFAIEARQGVRTAIEVDPIAHGCTVRNGSILGESGCLYGLRCPGPSQDWAVGGTVESLTVSGCTEAAILAGKAWTLKQCVAMDNAGSGIRAETGSILVDCVVMGHIEPAAIDFFGISAGDDSILTRCVAKTNTFSGSGTAAAIQTGVSCTLSECTVADNVFSAALGGDGIHVGEGSIVTRCTVRNNQLGSSSRYGILCVSRCVVTHCTSFSNTGGGGAIRVSGGTVESCVVQDNDGSGIVAIGNAIVRNCIASSSDFGIIIGISGRSQIVGNTCSLNQTGFRVTGVAGGSRIDGNNAVDNGAGFQINSSGNLLIRNSASGNTTNYDVIAGNRVGTVISPAASPAFSGSTGGTGVGTDPWANFSY